MSITIFFDCSDYNLSPQSKVAHVQRPDLRVRTVLVSGHFSRIRQDALLEVQSFSDLARLIISRSSGRGGVKRESETKLGQLSNRWRGSDETTNRLK